MNSKISCCLLVVIFSLALNTCQRPPKTAMRSLVPNEGIIYLETGDLAKTLESLTANPAFQELADQKPDFSFLENMQLAIVVTGFQTSEQAIGNDTLTLNFKPQFAAVAETNAWSWQTISFVENELNRFVKKNYGADAKLETSEKANGKFYIWTANDNRQVFVFVRDSLIYFGNDAATIEKCLAVKKGETESLLQNEFLTQIYSENNLAFGYISHDGIKQIANLAGVSVAAQTNGEADGQNFIARVLPQILRNTTKEIVWTANKTERGIEDNFSISLNTETDSIIKETLATTSQSTANSIDFLPASFSSVTRYNLKNPLIAWRDLLLLAAKNTDAVSGSLLLKFSNILLEPYGVANAELFLGSIDSEIITMQFDAENEKSVVIVSVKNVEDLKNSVSKEINFRSPPTMQENTEVWFSEDKQLAAAFVGNKLILGESESVLKCLQAKQSGKNSMNNQNFQKFLESQAVATTFGKDTESADKISGVLGKKKTENRKLATIYLTETRFTEKGIERKTVSDFGLIGTILAQLQK